MNGISKEIFDALVAHRRIVLPGVGSLEVRRRKAKQISDTQIIPPQNVVLFSTDQPDDADRVTDPAYDSWLEGARTEEGGILIEEVGEIRNGGFVASEALHNALNPANEEEIVTMEKERKKCPIWVWFLVGVVLAALIFAGIRCCKQGCFGNCRKKDGQTEAVTPALPAQPVTEPVCDTIVDEVNPAVAAPAAETRYHVIAGSFSIESNADNFMKKVKREHPELKPEKIVNPANGYNMVSIFSAPTERQAYNKMNMYWDIDLYLWVYKQ